MSYQPLTRHPDNNGIYRFNAELAYYVSDKPKVMQSVAGYYIGRDCFPAGEADALQPYSRLSGYFSTEAAAQAWVAEYS